MKADKLEDGVYFLGLLGDIWYKKGGMALYVTKDCQVPASTVIVKQVISHRALPGEISRSLHGRRGE